MNSNPFHSKRIVNFYLIVTRTTLLNFPASRLGKLMRAETIEKILEQCDEFIPGEVPEYFFDKARSLC